MYWYSICFMAVMKKQIINSAILSGLCISLLNLSNAQAPLSPVEKGSVTFNVGAGLGNEYSGNYYNSAFGAKAAIEVGLFKAGPGVITLGGQVGTSFSNGGPYPDYRANTVVVGGRSAWHHGWNVKGLDTYAGLSAGAGFQNFSYNNDGIVTDHEIVPVFGGFIGASYFITPNFGFNVEAGADITRIQGGIVLKLK